MTSIKRVTISALNEDGLARAKALIADCGAGREPTDCWPWQGSRTPKGYGVMNVGGGRMGANRASLSLALGRDLQIGEMACHHCDNPPCVNPDHLFAGSMADNSRDMVNKGRQSPQAGPGENNPRAVLTEANVLDIRSGRLNAREFSQVYGVSPHQIRRIKRGIRWSYLSDRRAS